jgi:hypothetical protein
MTDGYGVFADTLTSTAAQWDDLQELMTSAASELSGASSSGFAPSVQVSASAFLRAWAGFAGESATLSTGFAQALRSSNTLYDQGDRLSEAELKRLDGRLGPSR